MDTIVFTPAALLEILTGITELDGYSIGIAKSLDGTYQLQIGDSIYELNTSESDELYVSEDVVEDIDDINQDAYEGLEDEGAVADQEFISGGLLKEAAKSLLLGGAIRLAAKLL